MKQAAIGCGARFSHPGKVVIVSTYLLVAEVISALNRRVREGTVTPRDYTRLSGCFRDDCLDIYHLIAPNDAIIDLACTLLERHPLDVISITLDQKSKYW